MTDIDPAVFDDAPEAVRRIRADKLASLALRLLCDWTKGQPGECDEFMMKLAVDTAAQVQRIAYETLGAPQT